MKKIVCVLGMLFMVLLFIADGSSEPQTGAVIDIDGNVYKTVKIGDQWWMAENLRVTKNRSGHPINSYCYKDDESYCEKYGRLYTWVVAMDEAEVGNNADEATEGTGWKDVRGIAPGGWHIPTEADWDELVKTLGGEKKVAEMIRVGGPTGFNAHLSGGADFMGKYVYLNKYAMFWSSTTADEERVYHMGISAEGKWEKFPAYKGARIHIRCVKDKD
jgi:uncharacterized protein (TIGR02145 family)